MTDKRPDPEDLEHEELVAYLDGELDEESSRAVESRMNIDPTVRAEVDTLKATWDLLDYLPRPEPSPSFTHRTLDRLSTRETQEALGRRRARRWLFGAGWAAAVLLFVAGGYVVAVNQFPPKPSEEDLVRELRVIDNLDLYEEVDSLKFLKDLDHPDLFGEGDLTDS